MPSSLRTFVLPHTEVESLAGELKWMTALQTPIQDDFRVRLLAEKLDLSGMHVIEPGCLEGLATLSLLSYCHRVSSFDIRPQNVVKTWIRGLCYGVTERIDLRIADVLDLARDFQSDQAELIFHAGVFYHLEDPFSHLLEIGRLSPYLFLDTHTARPHEPLDRVIINGEAFHWHLVREHGWHDPASGKSDFSRWMTQDSLLRLAQLAGLELLAKVYDDQDFTNGPRSGWLFERVGTVDAPTIETHHAAIAIRSTT